MEIILKQDVDKLGYKDEIVKVRPGYARNFLIPRGLALVATESAKKELAETLRQRSHKEAKVLAEANKLAEKLATITLKIGAKAGESGRIFGSVNTIQIAEALAKAGITIDRKNIDIQEEHIKELGTYEANVKIHKQVSQKVKFEVVGE
jgi:large subunit ribosomal protein L9